MKSKLQRALLLLLCCAALAGCQKDANIQTDTEKSTADTVLDTEAETESETEAKNTPEWAKPVSLGKITDSDPYASLPQGSSVYYILPETCTPEEVPPLLGTITFSYDSDFRWHYSDAEERPFWNEPIKQVITTTEPTNAADPEYERVVISRTLTPLAALPEDADVYGATPSGHAFAFTCTPGEERDTYEGILQFDNEHGIQVTYYSYDFDENFVETVLLPKMESCRIWVNGLGTQRMDVRFYAGVGADSKETSYGYILPLPADWSYNGVNIASVWQNEYSGVYSTKRLEVMAAIFDTPWIGYVDIDADEAAIAEAKQNRPLTEGVTKGGQKYLYCLEEMEAMDGFHLKWYYFSVQIAGMPEGNYVYISVLTYNTDPAGYFEDVILPAIEGISFYNVELADEQAQP
mgnify:FL=1